MRQAKLEPLPTRARLAEFEILDILAEGDFGILYRSRDHILDRDIMLREYFPASFALRDEDGGVSLASERDEELFAIGLRGFIDEAHLLARLEHPALMKVYRFWEANGTAYMAMPLHEGATLRAALDMGRVGREEADITRLLADPLDALALLHSEGRVHGGIAPATILLRPDGRGLLLDLGAASKTLADLALTPTAMLQPGFAALEQYEVIPGLKPGPWTDVYATAAVAYNLIYGMPPPDAETRSERDAMLPLREIGAGRYSDAFLAALDAALALMPQERTATAAALRGALGIAGAAPRAVGQAMMPDAPTAPYTERRVDAPTAIGAQTLHAPQMPEAPVRAAAASGGMFAGHAATTIAADAPMAHGAGGATVIGEARAPSGRAVPPRKSRRRIPETAFVVVIAAALYAGFRSLPSGDTGATQSAPVVVVSHADAPSAGQSAQNARNANAAGAAGAGTAPLASAPATASATATPSAPAAPSSPATPSATAAASVAPFGPATASATAPGAAGAAGAAGAPGASRAPGTAGTAPTAPESGTPRLALGLPAENRTPAAATPQARASVAAAADAAQRAEQRREETAWVSAQSIDTPGAYESFLATFPDSSHAPSARMILARLRWEQRQAEAARTAQGAPRSEGVAPRSPGQMPTQTPTQAADTREAAPVREAVPTRAAQASRVPDRIALARQPDAAPVTVAPAQQPAETATVDGKTIRLRGQTMTGDFTPDPVTGAVSGRGRIVWDNGDRFEGTLVRGVKEGRGEFVWANGQRYRGDFAGGLPNGRGSVQFPNGNRYEGDMRNGAPNGVGSIHFANGNRYTGEVRDGLPNGRGTNRFANGDTYTGTWRMGQSDGQGRYTWANGDVWEGEFRNGVKTANGRMVVAAHDRVGAVSGASGAGAGASGTSSVSSASNASNASSASDADDPFLK